jgi:hypothetical protein
MHNTCVVRCCVWCASVLPVNVLHVCRCVYCFCVREGADSALGGRCVKCRNSCVVAAMHKPPGYAFCKICATMRWPGRSILYTVHYATHPDYSCTHQLRHCIARVLTILQRLCPLCINTIIAPLHDNAQATREVHGSLPLVNGVWPFRPVQSSAGVLQLPKPVTGLQLKAGDGVDQVRCWLTKCTVGWARCQCRLA